MPDLLGLKGATGNVKTAIIALVVAVLGLGILWYFFPKVETKTEIEVKVRIDSAQVKYLSEKIDSMQANPRIEIRDKLINLTDEQKAEYETSLRFWLKVVDSLMVQLGAVEVYKLDTLIYSWGPLEPVEYPPGSWKAEIYADTLSLRLEARPINLWKDIKLGLQERKIRYQTLDSLIHTTTTETRLDLTWAAIIAAVAFILGLIAG